MSFLSSLFRPSIRSIEEAERAIFRAFYVGFLIMAIGVGLIFTVVLMPVGVGLVALGGAILLVDMIWVTLASRKNKIVKNCPRCRKPNAVYSEERFFKCASCGYYAVLREV